jgi:V8-like Glu-specific endopeptidase
MKLHSYSSTWVTRATLLALAALLLTTPGFGQTTSQPTPVWRAKEEVKPFTKAAPPKPQPASLIENLTPTEVVRLEAPDLTTVLAEDAAAQGSAKKPQRIGIKRPLPTPVESAKTANGSTAWLELRNGNRLRVFTLQSAEAVAIRIHFEALVLPAGATLLVFNADRPAEVCGPYDAAFGPRVTVECLVPPGADTAKVRFQVREIIHGYVPQAKLAKPSAGIAPKGAGACNLDVTCSPEWIQTSGAVAGLGTIGWAGELWCTGCLVADADTNTFTDYFLTANHCVPNQTDANTLEFYWFYQTTNCNGAAPSPSSVPRTSGGADYIAGSIGEVGNDFTFLRLRQDTPANVTYAGWSSTPLVSDQPVIVIHHPQGDFKRISFGNQVGADSDSDFWAILWHDGTTEPGSSGSPLFNENHEIVGQLYGGAAACTNLTGTDVFGRFDVTFPVIQNWLLSQPVVVANDDFTNALTVNGSTGTTNASSAGATKQAGEPNHADSTGGMSIWFQWTAPATGPYRFDTLGSGFDTLLAVYTGSVVTDLTLVAQNDDISTSDGIYSSLVSFNASAGSIYWIAVDGYGGSGGLATLNWARWNDNFADALILTGSAGDAGGLNVSATKQTGEPNHAGNTGGASIWYQWTAPASGTVTFDTEGSSFDTLLAVYTGTAVGSLTPIASNDDIVNGNIFSRVTFPATAGTTYQIAVDGYSGSYGLVLLTYYQPGPPPSNPPANNNFAAAQALTGSSGTVSGSNRLATKEAGEPTHADTPGGKSIWYQWTAPGDGQATLDTIGSDFDTVLAVYTGSAVNTLTAVASNDDFAPDSRASQVSFDATAGTTYRIAVDGYQTDSGTVREGAVTLNWSQALPPTPPDLSSPQVLPNGQFQMTVNGVAGRTYAIDHSTSFSGWTELGTVTLSGATGTFTDTTAPGQAVRFYRARVVTP